MSRPESRFTVAEERATDAAELLAAFAAPMASMRRDRSDAIARLVTAGPDWREACELLGGAFAHADDSRLKARKAP